MIRVGGITTVVVAGATAACGLLMLGGVGPAPADADLDGESAPAAIVDSSLPDASLADASTPDPTLPDTTTPDPNAPDPTVQPQIADPPAAQAVIDPPPPIPLSVSPTSVTVGVGGTARISGECPTVEGAALGPVVIWEIGDTVNVIPTGVTAASWSYDWTAPDVAQPLALQAWCGDPSSFAGGYPEALQIEVVFVAQEAPTTTTTVPAGPHTEIPETG